MYSMHLTNKTAYRPTLRDKMLSANLTALYSDGSLFGNVTEQVFVSYVVRQGAKSYCTMSYK